MSWATDNGVDCGGWMTTGKQTAGGLSRVFVFVFFCFFPFSFACMMFFRLSSCASMSISHFTSRCFS
ncbi:hypothetical protein I7I53_03638 [Histoplasma capsulatum var. duboisii H88]|uniref:Uncharacterized protein n=1 Tax=Ajellomyces capsulatus (strain H88) TaxID=544711 RepID=A0A8A1LRE1_AJEC8|nr:hypothetical protein I7I53_03638 [Histoplasma capsulatum var. duboisii H88]